MIIWQENKQPKITPSRKASGPASWGAIMSEGASSNGRSAVSKGLENEKSIIGRLVGSIGNI